MNHDMNDLNMWRSGWSDPGSRGSLTYVDVSWETCAAAEPEQQREQC